MSKYTQPPELNIRDDDLPATKDLLEGAAPAGSAVVHYTRRSASSAAGAIMRPVRRTFLDTLPPEKAPGEGPVEGDQTLDLPTPPREPEEPDEEIPPAGTPSKTLRDQNRTK